MLRRQWREIKQAAPQQRKCACRLAAISRVRRSHDSGSEEGKKSAATRQRHEGHLQLLSPVIKQGQQGAYKGTKPKDPEKGAGKQRASDALKGAA